MEDGPKHQVLRGNNVFIPISGMILFILSACRYQGSSQIGMEGVPQPRKVATSVSQNSSLPNQTKLDSLRSRFGDFIKRSSLSKGGKKELETTIGKENLEAPGSDRLQPKETLGTKPTALSGVIRKLTLEEPAVLYLTTESEDKTVVFDKRYASVNSYSDRQGNLKQRFSLSEVDPQTLVGKPAVIVQKDHFVIINLYPENTPKGPVLY